MNIENKKQALVIILAIGAGIVAVALTGNYVNSKIEKRDAMMRQTFVTQQRKFEQQQQADRQRIGQLISEVNRLKAEQQRLATRKPTVKKEAEKKPTPSLALRTPAGKRAVTLLIDSLAAVGGLINPGDTVDIIAHLQVPRSDGTGTSVVTAMIFQDVQVLAINTNLDQQGQYDDQQRSPKVRVTFAVDPQEAGLLSFAEKNGTVELALRSPREKKNYMTQASTWQTLADYVLQNHGAQILKKPKAPEPEPIEFEEIEEDDGPYIQMFLGGREL